MKLLFKILILINVLIILVACFSDVIVNNNKLNLTGYNELLHNKNLTLNSIRNIFKNSSLNDAKTKKSFHSTNLITKQNFYQNIRPKPISVIRDYLLTKYNYLQPSVVTPNSVFTVNDGVYNSEYGQNNLNYFNSEITQANLFNFLNVSNPIITSTQNSVFHEQSIEVPEISSYELSNLPNYYPVKPEHQNIIYNTHQFYDFLNYAPPIEDKYLTTQKPPLNQIKPTTVSPKITTPRPNKGSIEKVTRHKNKPTTSTPVFIFTYPNKRKKPAKKRKQNKRKTPVKEKYVLTESPLVVAVENTLEGVYNYFEEMFTDTVQYPAHEGFETVEEESQSTERNKIKRKKKKRKKIDKVKDTRKPYVPLPYISSEEFDSSDTSDSSSSSVKENDSGSDYDSLSSEEYGAKTVRTIIPTNMNNNFINTNISKPVPTRYLNQKKTTAQPNNYSHKLNTKRITVRSLNTQTNKPYTTPLSVKTKRKITRKPLIGTSKGMVSHIHITNEFIESTTAITPKLSSAKTKKVDDSNESSSDYYDDYFDFDDTNDDDDDDDDEDEVAESLSHIRKNKKTSKKRSNKKKVDPNDSSENYYDDDEYDSMFSLPSIPNMLPSLPGFNNKETHEYNERHGRSTTPNNIYSVKKYPDSNDYKHEASKQNKPFIWYSPLFQYGVEETSIPIDILSSTTSEPPNWFQSWFSGTNEIVTDNPSTTTETSNTSKWWFPWLADDNEDEEEINKITTTTTESTTTTKKTPAQPLFVIPNPMPNAESFITFLTEKIKPKPMKPSEPENPNKLIHYNQYQLWRLFPQSTEDVTMLEEYRMSFEDSTEVQWWKGPALRSTTEILVSPNMTETVKEFLNGEDIKYETIIRNVQAAILYENPKLSKHEQLQIEIEQGHPLTWHRYHSYDDIIKFLEYVHRRNPEYVELIHMGRSYEDRPLIIAKVHYDEMILENLKKPSKTKKNKFMKEKLKKIKKKAVFIECGTHGREWMSPAAGTWIINNLIKHLLQNNTSGETVRSVDWYILPVMNPDGYQYSFEFDRFWRKTRSNHKTNSFNLLSTAFNWMKPDRRERTCFGVDPNRNWNVDWGTKGASQSKCSEFYMGSESNSEPEINALSKFLMEYRKQIKLFLSLHSYGQFISYPSMSNSTYSANEIHDVLDMGLIAVEALRNSDSARRYKVDTTHDMMSIRSGTSDAFAMHEAGIKYSYVMELRDSGHHGLIIPASYIESSSQTAFEMINAMVDYL